MFNPSGCIVEYDLGQVVCTRIDTMPLLPSSITFVLVEER